MYLFNVHISILSIVLSVIVFMLVGMLWYSPFLFGTIWMKLVDMPKTMTPAMRRKANISMFFMIIPALVESYVLALVILNLFAPTWKDAIHIAMLLWLGFIATTMATDHLFNSKQKPWKLFFINAGYQFFCLIIAALIIIHFR